MRSSKNLSESGSSIEFAVPSSPAAKVKERDKGVNQDPLYYHPHAHPQHAVLFKQKSAAEIDQELKAAREAKKLAEIKVLEDVEALDIEACARGAKARV